MRADSRPAPTVRDQAFVKIQTVEGLHWNRGARKCARIRPTMNEYDYKIPDFLHQPPIGQDYLRYIDESGKDPSRRELCVRKNHVAITSCVGRIFFLLAM